MSEVSQVAVGVHWLTFSVPGRSVDEVLQGFDDGDFSPPIASGHFGHPMHFLHESGAAVYFGSRAASQPIVVNAPGEVCEGWSGELLRASAKLEARVTRLDVAADLGPPELARRRLLQMHRAWQRGQVETRMSEDSEELHRNREGYTLYFGGRTSKLRFRVYDRRGPLRLEWQWRPPGEVGECVPGMMLRRGAGTMWRTLAESAVFPMPWYQELLRGDRVDFASGITKESSLRQALEQMILQHGSSFWAFDKLGLKLSDLAVPPEYPRGRLVAKWLRWANEADEFGTGEDKFKLDGSKLRERVQQWRKRKHTK